MSRYFIWLSFDGSRYHGWQVQPHSSSVQEELQRALSILLRQPTEVVGAGRTDAGVHARVMVAHIDSDAPFDYGNLAYKLNRLLPRDIAVSQVEKVDDELHARFSATKRTYRYFIHTRKDPFVRQHSAEMHYELDFDRMNEAAALLLDVSDFAAFCKSHTDVKTTLCRVTTARWVPMGEGRWYFEISADRFLRNMVRAVVGTLVDVGRHRLTVDDFRRVISSGRRTEAGDSMPACGLFLWNVEYD